MTRSVILNTLHTSKIWVEKLRKKQQQLIKHTASSEEYLKVSDQCRSLLIYEISKELQDLGEVIINIDSWAYYSAVAMNSDLIQFKQGHSLIDIIDQQAANYDHIHVLATDSTVSMINSSSKILAVSYAWDRDLSSSGLTGLKQQIDQELGYDFDPQEKSKITQGKLVYDVDTATEFYIDRRFTDVTHNLWCFNLLLFLGRL